MKVQGQLSNFQAVRPECRIVIGLCTTASIDSGTETTATCMASFLLYSNAFRFIYKRLAKASYGDNAAYSACSGKLHHLLRTSCKFNWIKQLGN